MIVIFSEFAKWIAETIKPTAQPMEFYSQDLTGHVPDHGTSHVTAVDTHGNAVSVTSTINQLLGSNRVSPSLGIVWNDQMDDFSTPGQPNGFGFAPSPANFIKPGKKPMSSMSPAIIYDQKEGRVSTFTLTIFFLYYRHYRILHFNYCFDFLR